MSKFVRKKPQIEKIESDREENEYIVNTLSEINEDIFLTKAEIELTQVENKLLFIKQLKDKESYLKARSKALKTLISKLKPSIVSWENKLEKSSRVISTLSGDTDTNVEDNIDNVENNLEDFKNG